MWKIKHCARVACIKDGLMDVRWIHNGRKSRKVTHREGATDREAVDKKVLELLRIASGKGPLVDKRDSLYVVNDALQVACDNHCGKYVGASPKGLSKRQTYLRPDHLPRHRPKKVVDPSDPSLHWMSNDNG